MSDVTVKQLAEDVGIPVDLLLAQLAEKIAASMTLPATPG